MYIILRKTKNEEEEKATNLEAHRKKSFFFSCLDLFLWRVFFLVVGVSEPSRDINRIKREVRLKRTD
jgi:hypothetical protein